MEELARFLMDELDELVATVIHIPLWKLGAALVLGTSVVAFIASLPEDYRGAARTVVVIAFGLTVLTFLVGPVEWRDVLTGG